MLKNYTLLYLFVLGGFYTQAQEIKIFKVNDFDLKGNVKSCMVSTKYGKEEYDFNEEGFLTKSVTRYSDTDYDVTYYTYSNGYLLEKRLENYRDNRIDNNTSIANIYTIDSLKNLKITEKIVSYKKEFLEQYEYYYNAKKQLFKWVRSNNNGIDETKVSYSNVKGEHTKTYTLNDVIKKSIRTSIKKAKDNSNQKIVLTKHFIEGQPNTAIEELYNASGDVIIETKYIYDETTNAFAVSLINKFTYDDLNIPSKKEAEQNNTSVTEEYVYQFDDGTMGNWVKKITTPNNTYITRKINYYETTESVINAE